MKKNYVKKDLIISGEIHKFKKGNYMTNAERKHLKSKVSYNAYYLYDALRTTSFICAYEISDASLAKILGLSVRQVANARRELEKTNLIASIVYGSSADTVTKLFIGEEVVALFHAGLPSDILNTKAHNNLKKEFGVNDIESLIANASDMAMAFELNPSKYQ